MYCMGANLFGQLGLGDSEVAYKPSPHLIEDLANKNIRQISAGVIFIFC